MPAPEVVAEEVPVALTFDLTVSAALVWVVCWGLLLIWYASFSPLLEGIANAVKIDAWRIHLDPGKKIRELDRLVIRSLQTGIAAADNAIGFWWHQTARLQGWIADETWKIARDTFHFGEWVVKHYGPSLVTIATTIAFPWARVYRAIDAEILKLLPKVKHVAHEAAHAVTVPIYRTIPATYRAELNWIHRHWKALLAAVAGAGGLALPIPVTWPQFRRAWRDIEAWRRLTSKRVKRLEALLAAAGLATAVANMTGTSFRCWRGQGNIARALRHVCGLNKWLLDFLILGAVEAFIVSDLCGFSDLLIKEAESLRPALLELVDVEDALIGCSGTVKPIDFDLAPLSLPPMYGPSALAA